MKNLVLRISVRIKKITKQYLKFKISIYIAQNESKYFENIKLVTF